MGSHRFFDHTGDFGVELEAGSLEALYAEVAPAFTALLLGDGGSVGERETRVLCVDGVDAADLLVALGNELLFLFEAEGFLTSRLTIDAVGEASLEAVAHGEPYVPERHVVARPIKAVTHHGVELSELDGGFWARLVFDL